MNEDVFIQYTPKTSYGTASKKCMAKFSPEKLTFSGNFTNNNKLFDITNVMRVASMRQNILDTVMKRTESKMKEQAEHEVRRMSGDENPMYEDPRDVIVEKPPKPPRKRTIQAIAVTSTKTDKDSKSLLKEQKRNLTKKYQSLITTLMDRCEENIVVTAIAITVLPTTLNQVLSQVHELEISEKDSHIQKLKEKLKTVLEYNRLFAEENDQIKTQHQTLAKYIEECKSVIKEERESKREIELRSKELEDRMKQFEALDKDHREPSTAIPLVEVCMSCSSRQIILNQAREQNTRLQKDMQALKDVLYRLNVQLSRYQQKLRTNVQALPTGGKDVYKPGEKYDGLDSLINASLGYKETVTEDTHSHKVGAEEPTHTGRVVDLSGLLSAQALAPLFDAYQENLQEKDSLILDYEKQFENINKKSKQIVSENKSLTDKLNSLDNELVQVRQSYKKLVVEKETGDIERATLAERAERAESKLKDVYELYEDKMSAMMRDYETVHREYFTLKNALDASTGKLAHLDALRARTVPADLHERRLDHCKRLLEELKHHYSMETERKTEQTSKLQEQLRVLEENYSKSCKENESLKEELQIALKNVRLYRKAAVIFRQRMKSAAARANRVRRSARRVRTANEPLKAALDTLENIKKEIKTVKSRASTSLEELERRIVDQERRAALAHTEYRRELERARLALEHKEAIIRSLIDKVADIEEVRLSQTNAHRLQGIVSDSDHSPQEKETKQKVKLVPGAGGYFQDKGQKGKG